ncbi:hypothetical protein N657DRAFT_599105 [Parathielavia appendiculata]|uniref:Uncharacterized protein n=1 Tax=Parathielavia appendiculata TaxID=2587402 RepID=A0AAN6Z248_9PEZI|nr:hypothetical protein N657DRAFT_599105 [Parathielavia appendiculata]
MHRKPISNRGGHRGAYRGSINSTARSSTSFASVPAALSTPQKLTGRPRLAHGCFLPKQIWRHFNPSSAATCIPDQLHTINSSKDLPDAAAFALIYVANQPQWMTENTIYVKSCLDLLPEYAAKKAILLEQHKEPSQVEQAARVVAQLTESVKFERYGIDDGPDIECFDEEDNISSIVIPGDWMSESRELDKPAYVDTPSVKYHPTEHGPIAVYASYGIEPDKRGFKFVAWFLIEEIELFAANSRDLARKMQHKTWSADMRCEWAAIKLKRVERGEPQWRPYPYIQRGAAKAQTSGGEKKEANGGEVMGKVTEEDQEQEKEDDKEDSREEDNVEEVTEQLKEDGKEDDKQDDKKDKKEQDKKVKEEETKGEEIKEEEIKEEEIKEEETKEETKEEKTDAKVVSVDEQVVGVEVRKRN